MKFKKIAITAVIAVAGVGSLTACTAKSYPSQCTFVVGNGAGDNHKIKSIVHPGESVGRIDDDTFFVPCNARNYIVTSTTDHGDRHTLVTTKAGSNPGLPVKLELTANWTLNQNDDVLKAFFPFCEKYTCYSRSGDDKGGNSANFSTPGWNGMLGENFSPAIDRAANDVLTTFSDNVWNDQSQWNKVADAFSAAFMNEYKAATGGQPFFCGTDSTQTNCTPVKFTIESINPVSDDIKNAYYNSVAQQIQADNQKRQLQQQEGLIAEQQKLAQEKGQLYGIPGYAQQQQFEYQQQLIQTCKDAGASCIISLGGSTTPVSVTPQVAGK